MAVNYGYVVDSDVFEEFLRLPVRQRERLVMIFQSLAGDPFQRGETSFHDSTDREIQKKLFNQWVISFWADDAVKEVRIVGIQKARR
jgi:hypothetical protein